MGPFAARALAGFSKPGPVSKNILAFQTLCGLDTEFDPLQSKRALDMGEVIIDLFLPDFEGHGQVPGTVRGAGEKGNHLLPYGPHARSVFRVFFHSGADPLVLSK